MLRYFGSADTKLEDFMCKVARDRQFEQIYYISYYRLLDILEELRAYNPRRFKRIQSACELEEFDFDYELADFVLKLLSTTNPRHRGLE